MPDFAAFHHFPFHNMSDTDALMVWSGSGTDRTALYIYFPVLSVPVQTPPDLKTFSPHLR